MNYLHSAKIIKTNSVQDATHKDRYRAWQRWNSWLEKVGLEGDPYLNGFTIPHQVKLVAGFSISIRRGEHSSTGNEGPLVAGTVGKAISNMAKIFSNKYMPDPMKSVDGVTHSHITLIIKSFRKIDIKVFEMERRNRNSKDRRLANFLISDRS